MDVCEDGTHSRDPFRTPYAGLSVPEVEAKMTDPDVVGPFVETTQVRGVETGVKPGVETEVGGSDECSRPHATILANISVVGVVE